MSDPREALQQIESVLAELLESYANLREKYIHGDADDYHSLDRYEQSIASEVSGIRQAANLLRIHRANDSGMGLPTHLWELWENWEREYADRLGEFLVVPHSDVTEPVGYIGLIKRPKPGGFDYDTPGAVWPTPPTWWVAHCREQSRRGDMEFVIGEIREVPSELRSSPITPVSEVPDDR